jgi:hypothetical protein
MMPLQWSTSFSFAATFPPLLPFSLLRASDNAFWISLRIESVDDDADLAGADLGGDFFLVAISKPFWNASCLRRARV